MRIEYKHVSKRLRDLPKAERAAVGKFVSKSTTQTEQIARILAPERSGQTKSDISSHTSLDGLTGVVEAIAPDAPRAEKNRAFSIEYGRKKGPRGTTEGSLHMDKARQYTRKRFGKGVRRIVRGIVRRASGNG